MNILLRRDRPSSNEKTADARWNRDYGAAMTLALLLTIAAAYFSRGFYHFDEHFQTLEFANFKLGGTQAGDLPWEFGVGMRSWLQPWLYWWLFKAAGSFGMESPLALAFIARLASGVFGWGALAAFAWRLRDWLVEEWARRLALLACASMFFMPFVHARTSGENLASSMLLLAVAATGRARFGRSLRLEVGIGVLLGLAFGLRFQVGFMVLGFVLWCAIIRRQTASALLAIGFGLMLMLLTQAAIDAWGYGNWSCVPWAYFKSNILQGAANSFGRSPPWYWLELLWSETPVPIGILLFAGTVCSWVLLPRHIMTWMSLPFLCMHVAFAHKETRFLIPAAVFAPTQCLLSYQVLRERGWFNSLQKISLRMRTWLWHLLLLVNLGALLRLTFFDQTGAVGAMAAIYDYVPHPGVLYVEKHSPYDFGKLVANFYVPKGLALRRKDSIAQIAEDSEAGAVVYVYLEPKLYTRAPVVPNFTCDQLYVDPVFLYSGADWYAEWTKHKFDVHQLLRCERVSSH